MIWVPSSTMNSNEYPIYTGFWTNWSYGSVLGSTLTLTRSDGNLVIAFVAFFLTIITTRVWAILCFTFHACFSTGDPRDTVHHQRQVLLRNSPGPVGTAWALMELLWTWRKSKYSARRVIPLLICCVVLATGFAVAAGFSSRISRGSEVLLASQSCSTWNKKPRPGETPESRLGAGVKLPGVSKHRMSSISYAERCYPSNVTGFSDCKDSSYYVQARLPFSVDKSAGCPFEKKLCASSNSNIMIDTGLIDSHTHLGINTPPNSRFQLRRTMHCAPLKTEGYRSPFMSANNRLFINYLYGAAQNASHLSTFQYPDPTDVLKYYKAGNTTANHLSGRYKLSASAALPVNGSFNPPYIASSFWPIPELQRTDADIFVFFLSANTVFFTQPTTDAWYNSSQHRELKLRETLRYANDVTNTTVWVAAEAASPLGCITQLSFCSPRPPRTPGDKCTPLSGIIGLSEKAAQLGFDNYAVTQFSWLLMTFDFIHGLISNVVINMGDQALTSRYNLNGAHQAEVAPDQWQQDVLSWNAASLAALQQSNLASVTGDFGEYARMPNALVTPANDAERAMCNQKVISPLHVSFSVFGLAFIGVFGLLTIIISFSLECTARWVQKRLKRNPYSLLEWYATGTLQLQRMAHEELGVGAWSQGDETIPVSRDNAILASLDISNEKHPVLRAAHVSNTDVSDASISSSQDDNVSKGAMASNASTDAPVPALSSRSSHQSHQQSCSYHLPDHQQPSSPETSIPSHSE
ncbi:hypothetical protein QBC43DRAFT_359640 [Cladorrhinum sp. PSN259]|nr:hypothetical protein QBC43DRAFT_359640 [Cladorrhinum sp. PSN259]